MVDWVGKNPIPNQANKLFLALSAFFPLSDFSILSLFINLDVINLKKKFRACFIHDFHFSFSLDHPIQLLGAINHGRLYNN